MIVWTCLTQLSHPFDGHTQPQATSPPPPIQVLATDGDVDLVRILKKNIAANTKVGGGGVWSLMSVEPGRLDE